MELIINYLPLFGVLAIVFVFVKNAWVSKQDEGNEKMATIANHISEVILLTFSRKSNHSEELF